MADEDNVTAGNNVEIIVVVSCALVREDDNQNNYKKYFQMCVSIFDHYSRT